MTILTPSVTAHALEAKAISVFYKERSILKDVSLQVTAGEIVGLLGPNGAGKTTFFNIIAGLQTPHSGSISIGNIDITDMPVYMRARFGIRYLPQDSSVFQDLTVEKNLLAILELVYRSPQKQQEKLETLLDEFQLNRIRKLKARTLSGGERRRLEIARCLIGDPSFILLDEPLAGIDPKMIEEVIKLITHLKEKKIGVLITDHNARETLRIANRVYVLGNGVVLQSGLPQDVAAENAVRQMYLGQKFQL